LSSVVLPVPVAPGTGRAWANARRPRSRRLVVRSGFLIDDDRVRWLEHCAGQLGLADLRGLLQARCDSGLSVPALARELGASEWTITQALATLGVVLPPRPEQLARQRRRYAEQRITKRVAELGFPDVHAYLADRLLERDWLLAEVAAELAAHRRTVRRLMQQTGVARDRRTARQRAAGERGRRVQSVSWQARRSARLAELGFADLGGYVKRRHVEQGWPVKRMRAELQVGYNWLVAQMAQLGLR
jgi:AraC-like DNA-binding protein